MPASPTPVIASSPLDAEAQRLLDHLGERLDAPALWWSSGYLAGLAARAAQGAPRLSVVPAAAAADEVIVLTASQTGNGRRLGERLRERLVAQGVPAKVVAAGDLTLKQLAAATTLLAVASTHGDGEPPDEARSLFEGLAGRKAPQLGKLAYAVFALGDSSYPKFCETGRVLDERLAALGARRLLPRVEADVDYADLAEAWVVDALAVVPKPSAAPVGTAVVTSFAAVAAPQVAQATRDAPREAVVLTAQRIVSRQADRAVVHYEIEGGDAFSYEPGDALGIWPVNPPAVVTRVLAQVADAASAAPVTRSRDTLPVADWLAERLEVTRVAKPFLEAHAERAGSAELKALLTKDAAAQLQQFMTGVTVADVLESYAVPAARRWTAADLVAALRPVAPRLYSIASSRKAVGDEIHLTVAQVEDGAASSHLWLRGSAGDKVRAYIEPNTRFRLPEDASRDILMIGPGTGVAPFRAFVQERAEVGATGRQWLLFGARHVEYDFLYQLEWQQALKDGRLHRLDLAFSRDQAHKIYVQHRLREQGAEVWRWLQGGASVYVCGDANHMAPDVHAALREVAVAHGGLDAEGAEAWLAELAAAKRYLRDVY